MSESNPPHDAKTARLKSIATIVASLAALVAALGAYFKPQDQSVNKASYEELSRVLKDVSEEVDKDHTEIAQLRGYVDGVIAGKAIPMIPASALPAVPSPSASAVVVPVPSAKPAVTAHVMVIQAPNHPAAMAKAEPVDFDTVMQRASSKK